MNIDALIARFRGPLIGLLASWGASARDAQDLAQDVFAEAYLSRTRFDGDWDDDGVAGAWLRGIASNLHQAHKRHGPRRMGERSARELASEETAPDSSVQVEQDEQQERLREAMGGLRETWRTVLFMFYVEGKGLAQVADLLGVSERSVEGRLHRARKELKRVLERDACAVGTREREEGQADDKGEER
ncbi:MAG: RNA polymerase sigma factor (sigma-70 family) [Candidatus Paceibacteria bacterium]|jgi:RNA polymerase sigma factor (sigma-70 family)